MPTSAPFRPFSRCPSGAQPRQLTSPSARCPVLTPLFRSKSLRVVPSLSSLSLSLSDRNLTHSTTYPITMSAPQITLQFPGHHHLKSSTFSGGLFINNKSVPSVDGKTIEVLNPSTGKAIGHVSEASAKDVDVAV